MPRIAATSRAGRCALLMLMGALLAPGAFGVISGIPDVDNTYSAVAGLGGVNCSAVLVARRVALTSAHCLAQFATKCTPYSPGGLQVRFAEPDGTIDFTTAAARTIDVQSIKVHHDATVDVSQCATGDPCAGDNLDCSEFNSGVCLDPNQAETPQSVNRSSELVVLFLAADAPPDVTPMKILVHPTYKNVSNRFVSFADIEGWAAQKPEVTAVGFGLGSETYTDGMATVSGRDRGVLRWEALTSDYGGVLGWENCTERSSATEAPAVVVVPDDITDDDEPDTTGTPAWCFAAAGSDIAGAQHSHVSCGDSGGPIVVGAGPGAKGATPTPLPAPAAGDTYSSSGRYVAGTASAYQASIGGRPATAYNPTWTLSASSFLTAHMIDSDGDGLVNGVDEFPGCNDNGPDQDLDGTPDECDPCPCDPGDLDEDGDGLCRTACYGASDNCWQTFNPGQENCNRVAELEHTPSKIWGDHCDPVPCPRTLIQDQLLEANVIDYHVGSGYSQFWVRCSSYTHNRLTVRPLRSHPATGVSSPPASVTGVATHARFCQRDVGREILCDDAFALEDARLADNDCTPPATCAAPETDDSHWLRMSFSQGGNGNDPNGPAPVIHYNHPADTATGGATWVWDYVADWQRWTQNGLITNAASPAGLDGVLWLHADTEVGDTDSSLGTGFHGDQLANNHQLAYEPQTLACSAGTTFRAVQNPFFLLLTLPDPGPEDFRRWDAVRGEASYVVPLEGSDWGAIDSLGNAQVLTTRMSGRLRRLAADRSLVWANAVEPFLHRGGGVQLPDAVALTADGSDLAGGMSVEGGRLDAVSGLAGRAGSPYARDFAAVYSRARRGVFVIGGRHPETRAPTGEIWFTPIHGETWRRIRTEIEPETVLAATYNWTDESLYVLDQTEGGEARLWSHDLAAGRSRTLGRWPRDPAWNRHWLVLETDGSMLLASSNSREQRHAISRIILRPADSAELGVAGPRRALGELTLPPLADASGYTLVTAGAPGWPTQTLAAVRGIAIGRGSRVEGDVAVRDGTTGYPRAAEDRRAGLEIATGALVGGYVTVDRADVERGGDIARGVLRTRRFPDPARLTARVLELPELPLPWEPPDVPRVATGTEPVILRPGDTTPLAPGSYGRVLLQAGSRERPTTLRLSGGRYGMHSLDLGEHTAVLCDAPCEVVIETALRGDAQTSLGPGPRELPPAWVGFFVRSGAAEIGSGSRLHARLFVARGDLTVGDRSRVLGTLVAQRIELGVAVTVGKDEGPVLSERLSDLALAAGDWSDLGGQL